VIAHHGTLLISPREALVQGLAAGGSISLRIFARSARMARSKSFGPCSRVAGSWKRPADVAFSNLPRTYRRSYHHVGYVVAASDTLDQCLKSAHHETTIARAEPDLEQIRAHPDLPALTPII
jgi:hypothetical protein